MVPDYRQVAYDLWRALKAEVDSAPDHGLKQSHAVLEKYKEHGKRDGHG